MRRYETRDAAHAQAVARALLDAADDPQQVRVFTGDVGRNRFEVDDDFPDVDIPEPEDPPEQQERAPHRSAPQAEPEQAPEKTAQAAGQGDQKKPRARARKTTKTKQGDTK